MNEEDYSQLFIPSFHSRYIYPPPEFVPPQPQVIVPTVGAAKYWYVDPRAQNPPSSTMVSAAPAFTPRELVNRTPLPTTPIRSDMVRDNTGRVVPAEQGAERADMFDRIRYPGMLERKTMDDEGAQATGTFSIDGVHYILPTKVNDIELNPQQAVQRFKETGEHLGGFETLKDAGDYERNYLSTKPPQFFMKRDVLGRSPRLADDRKDLLNDIEGTIYGGGHAPPQPTPTPTPTRVVRRTGASFARYV